MLTRSEEWHWPWRAGLSAVIVLIVVGIFFREFGFFVLPDPRVVFEVRDDVRTYEDLRQWPAGSGRFEVAGFQPCFGDAWRGAGWCLSAGATGSLRYLVPVPPDGRSTLVRLFFFRRSPEARSRLLVYRVGDQTPPIVFDNQDLIDARLDVSPALARPGGDLVLAFEGSNPAQSHDVMLSHFELRIFADSLPEPPSIPHMTLAVLALGVAALPLASWRRLVPLWMIVSAGFAIRYYALTRVLFLPEDYDASGYHRLAGKMALFTDTGFFSAQFGNREPLHVLVVKAMLWLLGDSETHVRLVSFFASLLAIVLIYRLSAKLFGAPLGLLGAFFFAVNLPLARESVRGLRLEVELVLLLVFFEVAFVVTWRSRWARMTALGVAGGVLGLLRTNYVMNLAPLFFVSAWSSARRRAIVLAVLGVVVMVGLVAPYRWNGYRQHGHPFWDQNARWLANVEFAGRPGWPSKIEMWRNTEGTGPRMTPFEYFFGLHTVPEFAVGSARGFWKVMRHMELIAFHRGVARMTGLNLSIVDAAFQVAGVVGLVVAAFTPGFRWMPVAFVLLLGHVVFLYDRGSVEHWRHTYHALPLVVFGALLTVDGLRRALVARREGGWAPARVLAAALRRGERAWR